MVIVSKTSSNLIDPEDTSPLTPENVKNREYGSKMVLVVEQMQIMTIWLAKGCLLLMYHRLTYERLSHSISTHIANSFQNEFETEPRREDCGRLRSCWICCHGNSLLRSMVQAVQPVLGCASEQWCVLLEALPQLRKVARIIV